LPAPLASETEVVNNPVTGEAVAGDAGPWMKTTPVKVAVNPGGRLPVPHSMAVNETATEVKPYPPLVQKAPSAPRATLTLEVKFQPVGAINVTVDIA